MTYTDFAVAALAAICALWVGSATMNHVNAHLDAQLERTFPQ